jgi:fatty acid desaturase
MSSPAALVTARKLSWADTLRGHARTAPVLVLVPATFLAVYAGGPWWAVALLLAAQVHFTHACLIGFHEAGHFNFAPARWYNDACGLLLGTCSFMSLTLYRAVHHTHHAYLGTDRDEELWPHTRPDATRRFRRLVAAFELGLGLVATPTLFLRSFLRPGGPVRDPQTRRRVWTELGLVAAVWAGVVVAVAALDLWVPFLVAWVVPALVTGNVTTWRKYVEHVGLTGEGPAGLTRLVAARDPAGRVLSALLFHEPLHGVHHLYAGLPSGRLPGFVGDLPPGPDGTGTGRRRAFPSYRAALLDLLRGLADPRVGPQWRATASPAGAIVREAVPLSESKQSGACSLQG